MAPMVSPRVHSKDGMLMMACVSKIARDPTPRKDLRALGPGT